MSAHCPLISVIVPVYNAEKFLVRCLTYLVNQTYKNLEILVVDDGCIDNSAAVVAGFARDDSRIRLIKQKIRGPQMHAIMACNMQLGTMYTFMTQTILLKQRIMKKWYLR